MRLFKLLFDFQGQNLFKYKTTEGHTPNPSQEGKHSSLPF